MISQQPFGKSIDGKDVTLFTLTNKNNITMQVLNYGCIVVSIQTPDRDGKMEDVVLGFDTLEQYIAESPFFGAVIGRYGNRIAKGKFSLDGKEYTLAINNGPNHLHGGIKSFDKVVWDASIINSDDEPSIQFNYVSFDGEEGYPGRLAATITYTLTNDNDFKILFEATTNKKTVVNLCQHSYFNLSGDAKRDILDHEVCLHADRIVAIDETSIPTGELQPVAGTPFDFKTPKKVGEQINDDDQQLQNGNGYDHTFVFNDDVIDSDKPAATVYDKSSGRYLEVFTQEPGAQFYTGNFLTGYKGKQGVVYNKRFGLCIEAQHFPDSPNRPEFPSVILNPGELYRTQTSYRFSVRATSL